MKYMLSLLILILSSSVSHALAPMTVGPSQGGYVVPTKQLIRPAGQVIEFGGRPVDMALSPDGSVLYVKSTKSLLVVDAKSWKVRQELPYPAGANSMHGVSVSRDGLHVYVTAVPNQLLPADVAQDGTIAWGRKIALPGPGPGGEGGSTPCGIALSPDGKTALVCLSRNNTLGVVDLEQGRLAKEIPVGVAPYDVVLSADGGSAFVSNWGGKQAKTGERTADSAGTPALVDDRGVGCSGTVSVVDLKQGEEVAQIATGLHPSGMTMRTDGRVLYVANANSDTVSIIDTKTLRVTQTIVVRPMPSLPFGSAPNALALSADGRNLYVANGGNNAVACVSLGKKSVVSGFIPAGWHPGAVLTDGKYLYIANVEGFGARDRQKDAKGWSVRWALGCLNKVAIPDAATLKGYTAQVKTDARVPQILRAMEKAQTGKKPVPVPERVGEPSTIEHVVYVIKENRTYDQLFGDMPKGNNDPSLCVFGKEITPNHHAIAEQFGLLDNFYCNGVVSADGHQWATQGYTTDYIEKQFGGWGRSYPYEGDDSLAFASSGFIWDDVLLHGLSFRNYGEMGRGESNPKAVSYGDIQNDVREQTGRVKFSSFYRVETLNRYSCPDYPGWNLRIPDSARADSFLREFRQYEKKGDWPDFNIVYLPNDHTNGTGPGVPPPSGYLAANDLALGQIVEAISKSRFWSKTCIFVVEDDPQAGFDHVDGHRSICLVISPYTRHGAVVSEFYNQTSVLHTMELILGIPPMNQMDAMAPVMSECFTSTPDLRPYTCLPSNIPLDQMNPTTAKLGGRRLQMARQSMSMRFDEPDMIDDDTLNRIIWNSVKGTDAPYPTELSGAHGKGLKALKLRFDETPEEEPGG